MEDKDRSDLGRLSICEGRCLNVCTCLLNIVYCHSVTYETNIVLIFVSIVAEQTCEDSIAECSVYGRSICTYDVNWSKKNCARYCGHCTANNAVVG